MALVAVGSGGDSSVVLDSLFVAAPFVFWGFAFGPCFDKCST